MKKKAKKLVKFNAIETVRKPVKIKFKTKDGRNISFKATKIVKKKKVVRFYSKKK